MAAVHYPDTILTIEVLCDMYMKGLVISGMTSPCVAGRQ